MTERFEVVTTGAWPSGDQKPAAVLRLDLPSLVGKLGHGFLPGSDDLGPFSQLGLRLLSGRLVLFVHYDAEPEAGPTVWVDLNDSVLLAIGELIWALELTNDDFTWVSSSDQPALTEMPSARDLATVEHFEWMYAFCGALLTVPGQLQDYSYSSSSFGSWFASIRVPRFVVRVTFDGKDNTCVVQRSPSDSPHLEWEDVVVLTRHDPLGPLDVAEAVRRAKRV